MYTTFMDSFRGALFKYFLLSLPLFYGGYVDIMFFFLGTCIWTPLHLCHCAMRFLTVNLMISTRIESLVTRGRKFVPRISFGFFSSHFDKADGYKLLLLLLLVLFQSLFIHNSFKAGKRSIHSLLCKHSESSWSINKGFI